MEEKNFRKYNSEFRKTLKNKISKLSNKNDFIQIYKIVNSELETKLSINRNGIYFNLNLLSDKSIDDITIILDKNDINNQVNNEQSKIIYETYNKDNNIETFIHDQKLTNHEKSIIKKFRQSSY